MFRIFVVFPNIIAHSCQHALLMQGTLTLLLVCFDHLSFKMYGYVTFCMLLPFNTLCLFNNKLNFVRFFPIPVLHLPYIFRFGTLFKLSLSFGYVRFIFLQTIFWYKRVKIYISNTRSLTSIIYCSDPCGSCNFQKRHQHKFPWYICNHI